MSNQQITVKDVIGMSVKELNAINIPVSLISTVGAALSRIATNLETCYQAISMAQDEQAKENDDDLEIVETGEVEEIPEGVKPFEVLEGGTNEEN